MDYEQLSDLELNQAVAKSLGFEDVSDDYEKADVNGVVCKHQNGYTEFNDWANQAICWAELLQEQKISLKHVEEKPDLHGKWHAYKMVPTQLEIGVFFDPVMHTDKKPGRAVSICFLKIKAHGAANDQPNPT